MSNTLTIEQFQSTRRYVENIGTALGLTEPEYQVQGFVYTGACFIELRSDAWSDEGKAQGRYMLTLANEQWISDDLTDLEKKLYEDAISEGVLDSVEEPTEDLRFWHGIELRAAAAIITEAGGILFDAGYIPAHNGGGCMVWEKKVDGGALIITVDEEAEDAEDITGDPSAVIWVIGRVEEESGDWTETELTAKTHTLADAIHLAAELPAPTPTLMTLHRRAAATAGAEEEAENNDGATDAQAEAADDAENAFYDAGTKLLDEKACTDLEDYNLKATRTERIVALAHRLRAAGHIVGDYTMPQSEPAVPQDKLTLTAADLMLDGMGEDTAAEILSRWLAYDDMLAFVQKVAEPAYNEPAKRTSMDARVLLKKLGVAAKKG